MSDVHRSAAPHLLSKSTLVGKDDQLKFIEHVGARVGVDPATDIRPALMVHTSLPTVKFVLDRWLTAHSDESRPFHVQMDEASRITLVGFE